MNDNVNLFAFDSAVRFSQHKNAVLDCFAGSQCRSAAFIFDINIKPLPTSHCEERRFATKQSMQANKLHQLQHTACNRIASQARNDGLKTRR